MLFSTSGFQSGAIEFASAKHIATVSIVEGKWLYETRAAGPARAEPPPWFHVDPFAGIRVTKTPSGISCHTIELARLDAIDEWRREPDHDLIDRNDTHQDRFGRRLLHLRRALDVSNQASRWLIRRHDEDGAVDDRDGWRRNAQ